MLVVMLVVDALMRGLEELATRAPGLDESPEAAVALALAVELDAENSATSKSMCAKALIETLDKLRALAPPAKEKTGLDALRDGRALRLVGGAAGQD